MPRSFVCRGLALTLCASSLAPFSQAQELSEFLDCSGAAAESILCQEHQHAIDARARAQASLAEIRAVPQTSSSTATFDEASQLYEKAVGYFDDGYYGDAAASFKRVIETIELLTFEIAKNIESLKERGDALLKARNYAQAVEIFSELERLDPDAGAHSEHLALAQRGVTASTELQIIVGLVDAADHRTAEERIKNFPKDVWQDTIAQLSARVQTLKSDERFNRHMNEGFKHLEQENWRAANQAFKNALSLKPQSSLARESLKDTETRILNEKLNELRNQYDHQYASEDFQTAKATLVEMLALTTEKVSVANDIQSLEEVILYEATLDQWLEIAQNPLARDDRASIKQFLATVPELHFGERIARKWNELNLRFTDLTTTYEIRLVSDNATEVVIQPGRRIGKFKTTTLNVYPGTYRLTGTRKGFHQVVRMIEVPDDESSSAIEIVCRDRF